MNAALALLVPVQAPAGHLIRFLTGTPRSQLGGAFRVRGLLAPSGIGGLGPGGTGGEGVRHFGARCRIGERP